MAYPILGTPIPQFTDSAGAPLASGTITTQDPDDDSVKASYPTAADADASTNGTSGDITLDSRGEPTSTQYWGKDGEDYKVIIKDSAGSTVYTLTEIRTPGHERRPTVVFTSADDTPTVAESNHFQTNDGTTLTDFDNGQIGDVITIQNSGTACSVTHNGAILILAGAKDFNMVGSDTLTLGMFSDQVWHEIGRSRNRADNEIVASFANTLTAGENGKTIFLNLAAGGSTVLPAPFLGANFKFIVSTAPTTAYTIDTNGGDNIMHGTHVDITAAGTEILVYFTAQDILTFVANTSLVGDILEVVSDGTSWFCKARTGAANGITTGQT